MAAARLMKGLYIEEDRSAQAIRVPPCLPSSDDEEVVVGELEVLRQLSELHGPAAP